MEDFNLPSAERVLILQDLQNTMNDAPAPFWAACQICDLTELAKWARVARESPSVARSLSTTTVQMVIHWTQTSKGSSSRPASRTPSQSNIPQKQNTQGSGSPSVESPSTKMQNPPAVDSSLTDSPPAKRQTIMASPCIVLANSLARSQRIRDAAKQRDGFQCILTGQGIFQMAHIYPYYSLKAREENVCGPRHIFWSHLHCFWPKEKVASWEADLFPNGIDEIGVERIDNLISLSPDAHAAWNQGAFALKPIAMNEDNTSLKIQFFWQKKQIVNQAAISLLTMPFSTEHLDKNEGTFNGPVGLFRNQTSVKSGDIFELTTDDPVERPLPNIKLIELQWFLTRVTGMAGAAVPYEEFFKDEDSDDAAIMNETDWRGEVSDDEISDPGLAEIEDNSFALSDLVLQRSSPLVRPDSLLPIQDTKHLTETETRYGV